MVTGAWKDFQKRLAEDMDFSARFKKIKVVDEVVRFAEDAGYRLSDEDLDQLTDLGDELLSKVAGGVNIETLEPGGLPQDFPSFNFEKTDNGVHGFGSTGL